MELLTGDPQTNTEPTPIFDSVFLDFLASEMAESKPRDEKGRFTKHD